MADLVPQTPGSTITGATRLDTAWTQWLEHARTAGKPAPSSLHVYQEVMARSISDLGNLRLRELTTPLLAHHVSDVAKQTPGKARQVASALRHVTRHAVVLGALQHDPMVSVPWPARKKAEVRTVTDAEVARLIGLIRLKNAILDEGGTPTGRYAHSALEDVVLLVAGTGVRTGEALALRWPQVDMHTGQVTINSTLTFTGSRWEVKPGTKSGPRRTLRVPPFALTMLRRRWAQRASQDWVYPHSRGSNGPINPSNLRRQLRTTINGSELEGLQLRDLRRTVATKIRDALNDAGLAASQLGHSSPDTTQAHYLAARKVTDATAALHWQGVSESAT